MSLLAQTSTQQLVTSSITAVTAQFQTLSTQTFNVSSINGIVPGAAFNGSTIGLSSATITTSTLGTNSLTTSSITSYGTVDVQGTAVSNVATEYFVKPVYTSVFTPTSIPNLKVWADASKLTSITSNGAGLVFLLSNLTGLGNFTSNAGVTPPTTGAFTMNNLNTLSFGGANALGLPSITYTSAYRSLFVVAQTTGNTPFFGVGSPSGSITTANYGNYFYAIGSNANISFYPISGSYLNMPLLVSLYTTSTSNGIFLNGSNIGAISPATFATGSFVDQLGVAGSGGSLQGNYYGASWNFCEVLLYDGVLTPAQRQLVEGYLGWKWGFQTDLIVTQPYYSSVPPPFGTSFVAAGSITTDTNSNMSFTANNKLRLLAPVEIPTTLSTASLTVSSINGQTIGQPVQSTVIGLGTAGYISTSQLYSTVQGMGSGFTGSTIGLSAATINTSTLNTRYLSSVQGYVSSLRTDSLTVGGPTGYVTVQDLTTATISTGQIVAGAGFISSLQINSLSFGPSGYVIVGDVIANSLSTTRLNTQALYANNAYIGNVSSQSAILFPGIDGNYRGTAVAERTTGVGTQELLLYKVSSTTDQIRMQTTGNIVFEAGAASRSWNSTTQLATPSLYIQGSTSNVGIGTATPAATLDVVGTGRFQTVSSLALNVSTINGVVPAAFNGSTMSLSTGSITTNSLQAYSYVNMTGGVFSNVATEYFTTPKYTTTFTPSNITGLKIWFDASQTTSILSNGTGQVYQWNNLATGFANATQATSANQPYTGLSNYNGLNAISFSGSNTSILNIGSISYTSSYRSFFIVYQYPATYVGGNPSITDALYIGNMSYPSFFFGQAVNSTSYNGYPIPSPAYSGGFGVAVGSVTSALGSPFYYNGSNTAIVSGSGSLFTSGSYTGTIGGGNPMNVCEYIVYDANLTASQRQIVEGYLAWKWGFQSSLINTHPYYTVAPPPLGTVYLPAGFVGTDATSNLTIQATGITKISLAANTQITGLLTASTVGVSSVTGTYASFSTLSTQALVVSSINGQTFGQPIQSTVIGLGNLGYISTSQLYSTVTGIGSGFTGSTVGLSAGTINVSTINSVYISSIQGYVSSFRTDSLTVGGPTGYVSIKDLTTATTSTGQIVAGAGFISSLQINSLSFGPSGYVIVGDVIANSLSTTRLNTQALYANNAYIGNVSSQSAILFPGIDGNYRGTAVAERTTGAGTGELLLYKVSSTTDQIRLQTTGNIVFEAGAAARSFPSTTQLATPTLYIAGSTSNVGIGTATPSYPLDVTGTARAQRVIAQPSGTTSATSVSPLAVTNGNAYLSFSPQIEFQYNSGGYKHFMGSRHNGNFVNNFGNAIDFWLYSAASGGSTASTAPNTGNVNTLSVTAAGVGIFNNSPAYALDVIGIINTQTSIQAPLLSTLNINLSSINGTAQWQESYLTSTSQGLGTAGYVSTTQLASTVTNLITRIGAGGGGGGTTFVGSTTFLSASQILFSTQTGYNISSVLGFVSSLQVDELQIGTGFGIIAFGDTNMSSISTLGIAAGLGNFTTINVSSINGAIPGTGSGGTTFTGTLGTVSSLTALRFFGLTGTYANTAVAEVSTGTGTQELLLYKVSSIADQVRVQTTGNVIFETGVGARGWPVATRATVPTFYVAGSNSNVGIGTSNPVTTLDVAGTGRFQTLSSLNITAGSINYSVAFV